MDWHWLKPRLAASKPSTISTVGLSDVAFNQKLNKHLMAGTSLDKVPPRLCSRLVRHYELLGVHSACSLRRPMHSPDKWDPGRQVRMSARWYGARASSPAQVFRTAARSKSEWTQRRIRAFERRSHTTKLLFPECARTILDCFKAACRIDVRAG